MNRMNHKDYKALIEDHKSHLEFLFAFQLHEAGAPEPEKEYRFHQERKWRFDFAWTERKLAVEIEGGTFKKSRHTSGDGFHRDCEKYNTATLDGWIILRFDSKMVNSGEAANTTLHALDSLCIK